VLHRIAGGDTVAFEELYRRTSARLLGACLRILPDRGEAEEALQDAYLAVWRRAGSFDPARGGSMTWLLTVARNQAVDRYRARRRVADDRIDTAATDRADDAPGVADLAERGEDQRRMIVCLALLEAIEARLIRTAFLEGSTYAELALRTATPLGTIKTRIRRGLAKLRECMR
jgi:RNA polymerase sigma-70 factor (ECF subfamily)